MFLTTLSASYKYLINVIVIKEISSYIFIEFKLLNLTNEQLVKPNFTVY